MHLKFQVLQVLRQITNLQVLDKYLYQHNTTFRLLSSTNVFILTLIMCYY